MQGMARIGRPPGSGVTPLLDRISTKFTVGDGCWEWTGARSDTGYGNCWLRKGKWQHAHRTVYELLVGPVPEGKVLDHLCRNRGCVRPSHLDPVDHQTNVDRGDGARKMTCPLGHPLEGDNVRKDGTSYRCLICRRARDRARWPAKRERARLRREARG